MIEPKCVVLVIAPAGLWILDTPRPESKGANRRRVVPVGTPLPSYGVFEFDGVPYAWLVPQNANKHEWCRMGEVDRKELYAKAIPNGSSTDDKVADAINNLAEAIRSMK